LNGLYDGIIEPNCISDKGKATDFHGKLEVNSQWLIGKCSIKIFNGSRVTPLTIS